MFVTLFLFLFFLWSSLSFSPHTLNLRARVYLRASRWTVLWWRRCRESSKPVHWTPVCCGCVGSSNALLHPNAHFLTLSPLWAARPPGPTVVSVCCVNASSLQPYFPSPLHSVRLLNYTNSVTSKVISLRYLQRQMMLKTISPLKESWVSRQREEEEEEEESSACRSCSQSLSTRGWC